MATHPLVADCRNSRIRRFFASGLLLIAILLTARRFEASDRLNAKLTEIKSTMRSHDVAAILGPPGDHTDSTRRPSRYCPSGAARLYKHRRWTFDDVEIHIAFSRRTDAVSSIFVIRFRRLINDWGELEEYKSF
jgi:hypothetical protein